MKSDTLQCDRCGEHFPTAELSADGFGYEQVCEQCRVGITRDVDRAEDALRGD